MAEEKVAMHLLQDFLMLLVLIAQAVEAVEAEVFKAAVAAVQVQVQAAVEAVQPCFIKQLLPTDAPNYFMRRAVAAVEAVEIALGWQRIKAAAVEAAAAMAAAMAEMLAELMQTVIKPLQ